MIPRIFKGEEQIVLICVWYLLCTYFERASVSLLMVSALKQEKHLYHFSTIYVYIFNNTNSLTVSKWPALQM